MSRGGRGGFGGRGGGPGGGGGRQLPPAGFTFQEIQELNKKPTELFPELTVNPQLETADDGELQAANLQSDYVRKMRVSAFFLKEEEKKLKDLPRYSDRFKPAKADRPSLKDVKMNPDFFPPDVWKSFIHGEEVKAAAAKRKAEKRKLDWDALERGEAREDIDGTLGEDLGEEEAEPDYDEDEGEDDYDQNYFDNGEGDEPDDFGGGGGDEDGGTYD